jgi:hypothetical protein
VMLCAAGGVVTYFLLLSPQGFSQVMLSEALRASIAFAAKLLSSFRQYCVTVAPTREVGDFVLRLY